MTRKVEKAVEETFRDTTTRGVKQGITKNSIDKGLDKVTAGTAEKLQGLLKKAHPEAGIADKAVKDFVDFLALNGAAEIVHHSAAVTAMVPGLKGITENKTDAFARYLRGYSGEKAGTKTSDTIFKMAPVLANLMSNPELKNMLDAVGGEDQEEVPQLAESNLENEVAQLTDDDD